MESIKKAVKQKYNRTKNTVKQKIQGNNKYNQTKKYNGKKTLKQKIQKKNNKKVH